MRERKRHAEIEREFVTNITDLQEILKTVVRAEMKEH